MKNLLRKKFSYRNDFMNWKKFARPISAFLFDLFLLVSIGYYTLVQLTQPDNLKTVLTETVSSQTDQTYNQVLQYCQQPSSTSVSFNITENQTVTISCSDIRQGKNVFITSIVNQIFSTVYYKNYTCEFFQCLQQGQFPQNMLVVFSAYGNSFFSEILLYSVIATIIFAVILIVSYETMVDRLKGFGKTLLSEGIPFLILTFLIGGLLSSLLPQNLASVTSGISTQLTSTTQYIFVAMVLVGAVLYTTGVLLQRRQNRK